ncbi:MAG: methionine--tRNA ligase [Bacteroidota bacterium]
MTKKYKRYLVTSALPYANGPLHIGHLAGAYLPADIYVRYLRLIGKDVVYIGGSDEHGAAITIKAKKEGITPQKIINKYHEQFERTFRKIGISFDHYHRTSAPLHHHTSQEFFRQLYEKGEFLEKTTEQYFDESAQQFLADRYIIGTCPVCNHPEAYGDQCENCGTSLSPTELKNPRSTLSGATPVLRETSHWFLQLDKYEAWLREWIEKGELNSEQLHDPRDWKNHVLGQCKSWLDTGLQARAMTRDLDWGIDVPPDIPNAEGKKLYVWMDAPIGYISSTKQWAADNDKDWEHYWKDEDTALIHFIGKDNIVFHCLIFPAILKATGEYILPVNVPANQFMNLEGDKISTSRNWAIWVHEYVDEFEGREDELRYNLIKNMPEQRDSEFTWKGFQETNNNELVNNLANFINRVVVLTNKYYNGRLPAFQETLAIKSSVHAAAESTYGAELTHIREYLERIGAHIEKFEFRAALQAMMELSSAGNQLLQFNEPWKLIKTDEERVKVVMHLAVQFVRALQIACRPFLPFTSDKIGALLMTTDILEEGEWEAAIATLKRGESLIRSGHEIGTPSHLFARIDDALIDAQVEKLRLSNAKKETDTTESEEATIQYEEVKPTIQFDDFTKLDLRTGKVVAAEKVKKADKLLHLTVDLGFEERSIVSGIAKFFQPEDIIGQQVVIVVNLAPRKLRGVESQGMILMAENAEGELAFVSPPDAFGGGFVVR